MGDIGLEDLLGMSGAVEEQKRSLDWLKWFVVTALLVIGVYGNHYFAAQPLLYRVLGLVILAGLASVAAANTASGRAFLGLLKESRVEIRKVIWPTRQETVHTTLLVLAVVAVAALLMFFLDAILNWVVSSVLG